MPNNFQNAKPATPLTDKDAIESVDRVEWMQAMNEEIAAMDKNTWKLVLYPNGAKPI